LTHSEYGGLAVPLVPNYLRAYRLWRVDPRIGKLAAFNGILWQEARLEAACLKPQTYHHNPEIPVADCSCGIYARYDPRDLSDLSAYGNDGLLVAGVMDASGNIELGERGLKSQFGTIRALAMINTLDMRLSQYEEWFNGHKYTNALVKDVVQNQYQLPLYKCMDDLVSEYPMEDLTALGINVPAPPNEADRPRAGIFARAAQLLGSGFGANLNVLPPDNGITIINNQPPNTTVTTATIPSHVWHLSCGGYHNPNKIYGA
jgi:hypothetical protein